MWPLNYIFNFNKDQVVEEEASNKCIDGVDGVDGEDIVDGKDIDTKTDRIKTLDKKIQNDICKIIKLKKFDVKTMKRQNDVFQAAIIGKRRTGKTVLLKDIIEKLHYSTENIYLFEDSEHISPRLDKNINVNTPDKLKDSFPNKKEKLAVYDHIPKQNSFMKEVVCNGSHFCTSIIHYLQYTCLKPFYRENIDYVFIFYDDDEKTRRRLWEHYGGNIPSFEKFDIILKSMRYDHTCLVIDRRSMNPKWEDHVYWYKADYDMARKLQ